MNNKSATMEQLVQIKKKLNVAIKSRATLEEDFKGQSSLLISFINKLSQVSKGMDIELDNRLAQLRTLFKKSAPISDIEQKIAVISKLLQQQSSTNSKNIQKMHEQFISAGKNFQSINGLPDDLRRNLRVLLNETKSTKDALVQYIPILSQLLKFYDNALKAKTSITSTDNNSIKNQTDNTVIDAKTIEKISFCLNNLNLSASHTKDLLTIKNKLITSKSSGNSLKHFIELFDIIIADLKNERDSAQSFLSSLSNALSDVQSAVKNTLSTCKETYQENKKINSNLQKQIVSMTSTVEKAFSLEQIKIDISDKLNQISSTLERKIKLETKGQSVLANQLKEMASKIQHLENQSKTYEKKLAEQRQKSYQDALTKLNNRAAFDEYFTKAMVRFHHEPLKMALAVIDIDDFKKINDTYGHTAGDKTLQVIANTLYTNVDKDVFVARYGGEEFVLIYLNIQKNQLIDELNKLNNKIANLPFKFKNDKVSITLSIGVSHITSDDNVHTVFERADKAMYQAKSQGKNQVIYL